MDETEQIFNKKLEYIRVLVSFKLLLCKREICNSKNKPSVTTTQTCEFYHSEKDKRRFPFSCSPEVFEKYQLISQKLKNTDSYSLHNFFVEIAQLASKKNGNILQIRYSSLYLAEEEPENCLNWTEFAYHPFNYKKDRCINAENCHKMFCSAYHNASEQSEFAELRNHFIEKENSYISFKNEIIINLKGISENIEKVNDLRIKKAKMTLNEKDDMLSRCDESQNERNLNLFLDPKNNQNDLKPKIINELKTFDRSNNFHPMLLDVNTNNFGSLAQKNLMISNQNDVTLEKKIFRKFNTLDDKFSFEPSASIPKFDPIAKRENSFQSFHDKSYNQFNLIPEDKLIKESKPSVPVKKSSTQQNQSKNISLYRRMESHKFILNQKVTFLENENFPNVFFLSKLDIVEVSRFICALLNSNGGTIFYGLTKKLIVNGQKINRKDFDFFQVNLDILLRNFQPRVMPDQIKIDLHKVYNSNADANPITDVYVLHFSVYSCGPDVYYTTDMNFFFIKKNSEILCLKNHEIVEYVQSKMLPDIKKEHLLQRINPQMFERMIPKDLDRVADNFENLLEFLMKIKEKKMKEV